MREERGSKKVRTVPQEVRTGSGRQSKVQKEHENLLERNKKIVSRIEAGSRNSGGEGD